MKRDNLLWRYSIVWRIGDWRLGYSIGDWRYSIVQQSSIRIGDWDDIVFCGGIWQLFALHFIFMSWINEFFVVEKRNICYEEKNSCSLFATKNNYIIIMRGVELVYLLTEGYVVLVVLVMNFYLLPEGYIIN